MSTHVAEPKPQLPTPGTLNFYISRGGYEMLDPKFESYASIYEALGAISTPALVAIDGPTNSGKTSFVDAVVDFYENRKIPVSRLPLDYFLTDRENRNGVFQSVASGELDIADYSHAAWNHDRYRSSISAARGILDLQSGSNIMTIQDSYDRLTGKNERTERVPVHAQGVLVTEGVGIHTYHDDLFDAKIRLDVDGSDTLLQRVLEREKRKPSDTRLADEYLRWRYSTVDRRHTEYLRTVSAGVADAVIDTSDFNDMVVYCKA